MSQSTAEKAFDADPAPLGLAGFAFSTFILSFANTGLFPGSVSADFVAVVIPLALFWGGLAQFIAGVFEMRKGNTFGATAFCSYGAFWFFFSFLEILTFMKILPAESSTVALGVTMIFWGIFTLYMWIPAMYHNLALNLVFLLLWITFFLLGAGYYLNQTSLLNLGGYFGLATAVVAAYTSFAVVTNKVWERKVIPVGPSIRLFGAK